MHTARRLLLFYGVALVNILTTLLPIWPMRYLVLAHHVPPALILVAQHLTLFTGVTMLLVAFPAAEGHRRAAQLLMAFAAVAILLNLLKGLDIEEAALNAVLLAVLWRGRRSLHAIPLRYTIVDLGRLAVAFFLLARIYDLLGKVLLHGLRALVLRTKTALPGPARLVHLLTAKLPLEHRWFEQSQLLLPIFLIGVFLAISWTSLMRARLGDATQDNLYARFGRASHNSLAYLARRHDVSTFLDPEGRGAITYRQVGRVALQVGAILAPAPERLAVYRAFLDFCRAHRLIPAAVALAPEERQIARACGLRTMTIGTEAVVDLAAFAVDKLGKKMRWVQRSLSRRGYTVTLLSAASISAQQRITLDRIDREWRESRGGQVHGCCMTLGRFPTHADPECLIGIASDPEGQPVAYLTLLPGGVGYYSLDLTRRAHAAPNAIMEFLLLEVLCRLRERQATTVSLNFSTFSSLASTRSGNAVLKLLGRAFQLGSLEAFNAKFRPNWMPRYVAFPSWFWLPDVAYAVLAVEGVDRMVLNALVRWLRRAEASASAPQLALRPQSEAS
jgi:lysyl-tRNA synthetase class 2